jgi:ribosomal protein S19E (S16A)
MTKWYNLTDPKHQEFFYAAAADLPRKPYPAVEGIRKTIELYGYHELRKHSPEDFYDDGFVRELDRSGYIDSLYK